MHLWTRSPEEYQGFVASIQQGENKSRSSLIKQLVNMQYERNDLIYLKNLELKGIA